MKTNINISQEEWNVLAKKYFGNMSAEEEKVFDEELKASAKDADLAEIEKTVEQIELHYKLNKFNSAKAYNNIQSRLNNKSGKVFALMMNKAYLLRIAAVLLLVAMVGSVWYFSDSQALISAKLSEVSVDDFGISRVELPDGTTVTLNRETKINYPDEFSQDVREVYIEGEAFFEVTPNPKKPFIIHAGDASIEVLGTSFNVNAYPESELVEVVVSTGKVQVYNELDEHLTKNKLILDPGDKGIFVNASKELLKMTNEDPNYMAWRTHHLIFRETNLNEVITQLSKLYRIQIEVSGLNLEEVKYSGHFENQSVEFILEVISRTLEIEVLKSKEGYTLRKES
ncbi:FecR family protein [Sunxiuqinia sp. A32]|uniref:FecR family protein n=1 Tax=Sunxiuqinia sp. A32 TaxID=3461496 RepID=UPI004045EB21